MTALLLAIAMAVAGPRPLTVTLDATPVPPNPDVPRTNVGRLDIPEVLLDPTLDGVFDDPLWDLVPPTPARLPDEAALTTSPTTLQIAVTPGGLAIAHPPVDGRSRLLVDPRGTWHEWLRLDVDDGVVTAVRCDMAAITPAFATAIAPRAAPCSAPVRVKWRAGPDGTEIVVPWKALPGATTAMLLQWAVDGDAAGAWSSVRDPDAGDVLQARPTTLPVARGFGRVTHVPEGFHVEIVNPRPGTHWTLWLQGDVLGAGTTDATVRVKDILTGGNVRLELVEPDPLLPRGRVQGVLDPQAAVHVPVPLVRDDRVDVAWHTRVDLTGVRFLLWSTGRRPWAQAVLDLPDDTGVAHVVVPPDAPEPLWLEVDGLLAPVRLRRAPTKVGSAHP